MRVLNDLTKSSLLRDDYAQTRTPTEPTRRVWSRTESGFTISYLHPLDRFVIHETSDPPAYDRITQVIRQSQPFYSRFVFVEHGSRDHLDSLLCPFLELCVETTTACNLRCRICISESSPQANEFLSLLALKQTLSGRKLPLRLTLTGGEFFVHPQWRRILDYLLEQEVGLVISTNGTLLSKEMVKHLSGLPIVFALSLDGLEKTHDLVRRHTGNFRRVCSALNMLREANLPVHVYSVLQECNMDDMIPLTCSLSAFKITEHRIMYVIPRGRGANLRFTFKDDVLDEFKKLRLPHLVTIKTHQHLFPLLRSTGHLQWLSSQTLSLSGELFSLRQILGGYPTYE